MCTICQKRHSTDELGQHEMPECLSVGIDVALPYMGGNQWQMESKMGGKQVSNGA